MPNCRHKIRVLLVDDHAVVLQGIRLALENSGSCEVVGQASTVSQAVTAARRLMPDVVLLDAHLGDEDGLDACRAILGLAPGARVLVLSAFADEELVRRAVRAGAAGYALKHIDVEALARAIERVAAGETVFTGLAADCLAAAVRRREKRGGPPPLRHLSSQERKVMAWVAEGKTNKAIAAAMALRENTVKHYLGNIMAKLNLRCRAQVAAYHARHSPGRRRAAALEP